MPISGCFMLLGIIAKNGIMMVDFAKQYKEEHPGGSGLDAHLQLLYAAFPADSDDRTFNTIMGTLPIALGIGADGASRVPLGLIIVGGMIFAQVITLFVTPGIYLYMDWIEEHTTDKKRNESVGNERSGRYHSLTLRR